METKLSERAFPLQNLELERTDVFLLPGKGKDKARVLMGIRDPGEAAALLPVLGRLKEAPIDVCIWTDSRAKERLNSSGLDFLPLPVADPLLAISAIRADLVVTGISMRPGAELALTENAHYDGVPVVWLSDHVMGSALQRQRDIVKSNPRVIPDYLLVASDWVREQELKNLPEGFDPNKIIVTGQPAFDRLAMEDKVGTRRRVRQELGISDNEKLVTYIGAVERSGDQISRGSLKVLVDGLTESNLENYKLVIRRHPRDSASMESYLEIAEPVGESLVDTSGRPTDEIILSSDLVVNTISTAGMESVYRGIPVVHIWINDLVRKSELGDTAILPPIVEDGTSPVIYKEEEAPGVLKKLLTDQDYNRELQQRMTRWQVDGHAAERVSDFILHLLRKP